MNSNGSFFPNLSLKSSSFLKRGQTNRVSVLARSFGFLWID